MIRPFAILTSSSLLCINEHPCQTPVFKRKADFRKWIDYFSEVLSRLFEQYALPRSNLISNRIEANNFVAEDLTSSHFYANKVYFFTCNSKRVQVNKMADGVNKGNQANITERNQFAFTLIIYLCNYWHGKCNCSFKVNTPSNFKKYRPFEVFWKVHSRILFYWNIKFVLIGDGMISNR